MTTNNVKNLESILSFLDNKIGINDYSSKQFIFSKKLHQRKSWKQLLAVFSFGTSWIALSVFGFKHLDGNNPFIIVCFLSMIISIIFSLAGTIAFTGGVFDSYSDSAVPVHKANFSDGKLFQEEKKVKGLFLEVQKRLSDEKTQFYILEKLEQIISLYENHKVPGLREDLSVNLTAYYEQIKKHFANNELDSVIYSLLTTYNFIKSMEKVEKAAIKNQDYNQRFAQYKDRSEEKEFSVSSTALLKQSDYKEFYKHIL